MTPNAAIFYHAEGFDTSGERLMGRHAAGEGFFAGFVRHAGVEPFCCFARDRRSFEDFTRQVEGFAGAPRPTRWIPHARHQELADPGCLFYPGPNIDRPAWLRRHVDPRSYSLCGVTHTTASEGVMDSLGHLLIAPLQPWDAIICTSKAVLETVEPLLATWAEYLDSRLGGRAHNPVQLRVIPLGVDCDMLGDRREAAGQREALRTQFGIGADDVAVLFLGRLSFHAKAHPLPMYLGLEEAAQAAGRAVHLIQAGWFANDAIETQFKDAAARYCPSVRALFVDGRNAGIRRSIWHAADIFTSLSDNIQETFGLTPLEAMAAGLPVVVSDWDGYRETVRDGVDGFMIPTAMPPAGLGEDLAFRHAAGIDSYDRYLGHASQCTSVDPAAAAEAYRRLVCDPELRRTMGDAGRQRAREHFDWRVVIAAYQELWAELAERRSREPPVAPRLDGRPAHPLRADPFALFAAYASRPLDGETLISLAPGADGERLDGFRTDRITGFAETIFASSEECAALLARLDDAGPLTAAEILTPFEPKRRRLVHRTLLWLAKTGLIRIEPADG